MLKKILFLMALIISICIFALFLNYDEIDKSYSYDDYEKEITLIKSRISIDNDISLIKSYDLVNKDRVRLYTTDNDSLIFVHSERENKNFTISDTKVYELEKNNIHTYTYKKNNENVYVLFGYNSDYTKAKFECLDKYGQKITQEKNMFKNDYNIVTFISDYEGECNFE